MREELSKSREENQKILDQVKNNNFKNVKKTWDGIKSIINISNMKSMSPSSLNIDNKLNTNPVDIANCFNDYFSTIGSKLANNIFPSKHDHMYFLKSTNPMSFFLNPVSEIEILNLISTLNNSKASGPYSIPTDIFKVIKNIIAHPLTEIINLSFLTGIYPNNLKIAKVVPIFKNKGCYAVTFAQFHLYQTSIKFLKN